MTRKLQIRQIEQKCELKVFKTVFKVLKRDKFSFISFARMNSFDSSSGADLRLSRGLADFQKNLKNFGDLFLG